MSVYAKESPIFLAQCLDSISAQTVKPDELIIVKDGPLTEELEAALRNCRFSGRVHTIALPENVTQGPARAEGLTTARHSWVAIMDSDDICRPDRFEKQLSMIEREPGLGLLGGQIAEFAGDRGDVVATRNVPAAHSEIIRFAKKRNPFNHMTVMLRRDLAIRAGNYRYFPWFEDYDLWTRMISKGAVCANHSDVLVDVRVGSGMYGRRHGASYIRSELRMQKQLKDLGFIGAPGFVRNTALRLPVRLLPEKAVAAVYGKIIRRK